MCGSEFTTLWLGPFQVIYKGEAKFQAFLETLINISIW